MLVKYIIEKGIVLLIEKYADYQIEQIYNIIFHVHENLYFGRNDCVETLELIDPRNNEINIYN
jgi:hypothetical protein